MSGFGEKSMICCRQMTHYSNQKQEGCLEDSHDAMNHSIMSCGMMRHALLLAIAAILLTPVVSLAQAIRLHAQREVRPPDYATFRLGPLYSTMALTETVGYRYTSSSGAGTDYLSDNERGRILKDGSDYPIISTLSFRNYLIITRRIDLDASIRIGYEYYPMDTQEDEFLFDMTEEGIYGNISSAFRLSKHLSGTIYDNFLYKTDYVDVRGEEDRYGGSDYERLDNTVGMRLNWQLSRRQTLSGMLSRRDVIPRDDEFAAQEKVEYTEGVVYTYRVYDGLDVGGDMRFTQIQYTGTNRPNANINTYSVFARASEGKAWGLPIGPNNTLTASLGVSTGYGKDREENEEGTIDSDADSVSGVGSIMLETQMSPTLNQTVSYSRSMGGGYSSAFEVRDTLDYRLRWQGKLSSVQFYSTLSEVAPTDDSDADYRSWITGLDVSYPLTHYITLIGSTSYSVRENEERVSSDDDELELSNDYDTWTSRIGTSFRLTRRISFRTYAEHTERISDEENLDYERDTVAAYLTYHRQF